MLLEVTKSEVSKSNISREMAFSIGDSKVLLNILRNKIYTNPMRAMLQEVISNAIDANIENKCPEKPITIHAPFVLEPYFFVKDSGIGISPERMEAVFLKYGCSTKRGSNDQIGGFGIGAKSPFAYTDQFVIETISQDGYERHYTAFLDEESDGKLAMTFESPTDKETGTTIRVGIREEDVAKIRRYVEEICSFFKVPPIYIGEDLAMVEFIKLPFKNDDSWEIAHLGRSYHEEVVVVIRGIPYVANSDLLRGLWGGHATLVLYCDVGEITSMLENPSAEEILYDPIYRDKDDTKELAKKEKPVKQSKNQYKQTLTGEQRLPIAGQMTIGLGIKPGGYIGVDVVDNMIVLSKNHKKAQWNYRTNPDGRIKVSKSILEQLGNLVKNYKIVVMKDKILISKCK